MCRISGPRGSKGTPKSPTDRRITSTESQGHGETETLIENPAPPPPPTFSQQALLQQAFVSTAYLANWLPTGTLLAFQYLTPLSTNNGSCDAVTRLMTLVMLLLLAAFSFLACFTDSFQSQDGQVYYGFAIPGGMWLFDSAAAAAAAVSGLPDLTKHKLRFLDFVHGALTVLVFGSVALRDKNVMSCFYPQPKHETQEILNFVPLGVGFMCILLFAVFPTRRHDGATMCLGPRPWGSKGTPKSPTDWLITITESQGHGEKEPLIENPAPPLPPTFSQQALLQQAFASTAYLANWLPTGTLLAFQYLTPLSTNNGSCDAVTRLMTLVMLLLLAAFSFLACFTDSFQSQDGQVHYGFATPGGMWLFDSAAAAAAAVSGLPDLTKHKLRFLDFVHGVLTVLVFGSVALRDENVMSCFYAQPKHETQEILNFVPLGVGFMCILLFAVFPTRRHGTGYPVTRDPGIPLGNVTASTESELQPPD